MKTRIRITRRTFLKASAAGVLLEAACSPDTAVGPSGGRLTRVCLRFGVPAGAVGEPASPSDAPKPQGSGGAGAAVLLAADRSREGESALTEDGKQEISSPDGLSIPLDSFDFLVFRMRVQGADKAMLSWSLEGWPGANFQIEFPLQQGGEFQEYRIPALSMKPVGKDVKLGHVRLAFPGTASIDVGSITAEKQVGQGVPVAACYHLAGDAVMPSLAVLGERSLSYSVSVPPDGFFEAYVCADSDSAPSTFEVWVRSGETSSLVASAEARPAVGWDRIRADLSRWANRNVSLELKTKSQGSSHVSLWGNPVLLQSVAARSAGVRATPSRGPNVLIYLIDCMRADHLDVYGYARETAPHIRRFAEGGVRFTDCVAPYTSTKQSVASLFTGVSPLVHRAAAGWAPIPASLTTLAESFRSRGYSTASFVENLYAGKATGLHRGFDATHLLYGDYRAPAGSGVAGFLEENSDRPFFAYVHTMEPHDRVLPGASKAAYHPPERLRSLFAAPGEARPVDLYDACIRHADAGFGDTMSRLHELGLEDRTVVVLIADHGEAFGEHGCFQHSDPPYQHQIGVPLILRLPGVVREAATVDERVQLLDLAPTLCELANAPAPEQFQGQSLVPLATGGGNVDLQGRTLFSAGHDETLAVLDGGEKLIGSWKGREWRGEPDGASLYDLGADPKELVDLAGDAGNESRVTALKERLKEYVADQSSLRQSLVADASSAGPTTLDAGELREMEALGYL